MSGEETWKKWRNGVMRIKEGDLVRFRAYNGDWAHLWDQTGIVLTNPKEKVFQLTPKVTSLSKVVDVLVGDKVIQNVRIDVIEKKKST